MVQIRQSTRGNAASTSVMEIYMDAEDAVTNQAAWAN
jgi:hypothetical protein